MPADTIDGTTTKLVTCGNEGQKVCQLSDLFSVANLFAEYVIKFFLPTLFFVGLFLTFWPIVKNPSSAEALAEAKGRFIKLLIGTVIVVGAYIIVRVVLLSIGVDSGSGVLQKAVGGKPSFNAPLIERAYADYLPGPSGTVSKKANGEVCANSDECQSNNCVKDVGSIKLCQAVASNNPTNTTNNNSNSGSGSGKFNNPLDSVSIQTVVAGIANVVVYLGTIGVIYLYIRGAMYLVMSQERPDNLSKGKKYIFWATVIGLCIFGAEMIYTTLVDTTNSIFKTK